MHAEDRGFQFADAVYEVCEVKGGRLVDETRHMQRLRRSLGELRIPAADGARRLVARAARNHPAQSRRATASSTCRSRAARARASSCFRPTTCCRRSSALRAACLPRRLAAAAEAGIAVKTMPDTRWARCDIKTVMLLPAALAKEAARSEGAKEAWFVDDQGYVTEGASSNAWIVDKEGRLVTRQIDNAILRGVTRTTLIDVLKREAIEFVERPFTVEEAKERARGVHHLCHQHRHAGREHRRAAHRQRRAGPAHAKAAVRISCVGGVGRSLIVWRHFWLAQAANLLVQSSMNLQIIVVGVRAGACRLAA